MCNAHITQHFPTYIWANVHPWSPQNMPNDIPQYLKVGMGTLVVCELHITFTTNRILD